jgi:hypothetical protein
MSLTTEITIVSGAEASLVTTGSMTMTVETSTIPVRGPRGFGTGAGEAAISTDPLNRLKPGSDGGLYVSNDLDPDPLAYYILAKG